MSFGIDGEKLLEKYKAIWTDIEYLNKYRIKCFTSLWRQIYRKQNFIIISIDALLVYVDKYYLQAYLDNCDYKL